MNRYYDALQDKWGKFIKKKGYCVNGPMRFISKDAWLNEFFKEFATEEIEVYFKKVLGAELHPELRDFYAWTNGCRLFFSSLSIYGILPSSKDKIVPFDIEYENKKLAISMGANKYLFFASIGGEYVFGYDKETPSNVYGMKVGDISVLQTFNGINDFFDHYFDILIDEYGVDCKKLHPAEAYKGIPVLENKCTELL